MTGLNGVAVLCSHQWSLAGLAATARLLLTGLVLMDDKRTLYIVSEPNLLYIFKKGISKEEKS
jgi:hypothetical protein